MDGLSVRKSLVTCHYDQPLRQPVIVGESHLKFHRSGRNRSPLSTTVTVGEQQSDCMTCQPRAPVGQSPARRHHLAGNVQRCRQSMLFPRAPCCGYFPARTSGVRHLSQMTREIYLLGPVCNMTTRHDVPFIQLYCG
jgi:hypothetical protein